MATNSFFTHIIGILIYKLETICRLVKNNALFRLQIGGFPNYVTIALYDVNITIYIERFLFQMSKSKNQKVFNI